MPSNTTVTLAQGYQAYFSLETGFEPEANIVSTAFYNAGLFDWRYVVVFADGSGVVFGFPGNQETFLTNNAGHLILTGSPEITFVGVYAPGTIPPPDEFIDPAVPLATLGGQLDWSGSVFAPDFLANWLGADNFVLGHNGTAPDPSITGDQQLRGYAGSDRLYGGNGNDTFFAGAGADGMAGGAGSDTFVFEAGDHAGAELINGNEGFGNTIAAGEVNTIEARVDLDLTDSADIYNINRIVFAGAASIAIGSAFGNLGTPSGGGAGTGIVAATQVVGDAGANALAVRNRAYLDLRDFSFAGWSADDSVTIEAVTDTGIHQMFAPDVATTVIGDIGRDWITGGDANDQITGADNDDILDGGGGADVLRGGAGLDVLHGGGDGDTILIDAVSEIVAGETYDGGTGTDTLVVNVNANSDLSGVTLAAIETLFQSYYAWDTMLTAAQLDALKSVSGQSFTLTGGGAVSMNGVSINAETFNLSNAGNSFSLAGSTQTLALTINGGTGNDTIVGGLLADTLNGGEGADTLRGATSGSAADLLNGGGGNDLLIGANGGDTLDGGTGADEMRGGQGEDVYWVDESADAVVELAGEGSDLVRSTASFGLAGQYIEVLELLGTSAINGTGNGLANRLVGNSAANVLYGMDGNDRLDGQGGADTMRGGMGNDTYVVDNAGDVIQEDDGQGTDTVEASITYSLVGKFVEVLVLTGAANINGTGNGLANTLIGNSGNNTLNGNGGADSLRGGAGDDILIVDNAGDTIVELNGEGHDTVQSSATFSLAGQYAEDLMLTGSANINGTGNGLANVLTGNSGANLLRGGAGDDHLHGGLGSDTLAGEAGADHYWFETALGASNVDTIAGFVAADDTIHLDRSIFAGIAANGVLAAGAFRLGAAALDADDRILYDAATGNIWYDSDGAGGAAAVLFAKLAAGTALTNADFFGEP